MRGNFGIRSGSTLHSTPSRLGACLLLRNVLTRSQCWAPHSPRKHGELGLRDTHADRMSGHVPVQLGEKGQVGDPDRGQSHTNDPHCCSQTPGTCGQPVPLVPSTDGDHPQ